MKKPAIRKNISMYDEWDIVAAVNEEFKFNNRSFAIRHIINQYKWYREESGNPIPTPAKEEEPT